VAFAHLFFTTAFFFRSILLLFSSLYSSSLFIALFFFSFFRSILLLFLSLYHSSLSFSMRSISCLLATIAYASSAIAAPLLIRDAGPLSVDDAELLAASIETEPAKNIFRLQKDSYCLVAASVRTFSSAVSST
jgi:hypothetical protein